jgi:aspartyl-tRNA(Asn)/glutamyl-tRNA(Gln) amidotransferase subunit C
MDSPTPPASAAPAAAAVERALRLARLAATPLEGQRFAAEFERVLASFSELARIDVSGVEPLATPSARCDVLREDVLRPSLEREQLLANAPQPLDGFFGVPKTIGGES